MRHLYNRLTEKIDKNKIIASRNRRDKTRKERLLCRLVVSEREKRELDRTGRKRVRLESVCVSSCVVGR
jgi:hypothetical protein